ncbi:MAG: TlpA family protein disulfide reductase [Phycisphaerales bacterium]
MSAIFSAIIAMLTMMSLVGTTHTASEAAPAVEPIEVDATAYNSANWPTHNRSGLNAKNVQGKELEIQLGSETWLTAKKNIEGKVLVLDFWAVWCPPCRAAEPKFHALQKAHTDKLEIIAISGQGEDQDTVESYIGKKTDLNYTHLFDQEQRIYKSLQIRAIPHVVILSTDGVVRWQGNPHQKAFKQALEQVIENDPLIQAKFAG